MTSLTTPYEGQNYTISNKITPLRKRKGEPPEIQIGCYRGNSRTAASLGLITNLYWLNATFPGLRYWNFHLLSFWMAVSLLC